MQDTRLFRSIRLENILSYGPDAAHLELEPLNVLIGPNASGKSNLIDALSVLAAAPRDVQVPIREGGGVSDWLWKGTKSAAPAKIEVTVDYPAGQTPLRYRLAFTEINGRFSLVDEAIENEPPFDGQPAAHYAYHNGRPIIGIRPLSNGNGDYAQRTMRIENVSPEQSILSQRRDPDSYAELTYLGRRFEQIRFYREWNLGRSTRLRQPQRTDLPGDFLLEDGSNLALVLNDLDSRPSVRETILARLRVFYSRARRISTKVQGGTIQVFLEEDGLSDLIPAMRLSDGMLRYLSLLAVLCHPEPPPLICIEEPELGLHPDVMRTVAEMLVEASQRTQLIVTTHSEILIDALSEHSGAVVVCERYRPGTTLERLEPKQLDEWLERHSLGELWRMGEIGGNPQ
jgi:predicted ATPase